jgi:hypothetical protein
VEALKYHKIGGRIELNQNLSNCNLREKCVSAIVLINYFNFEN